MGKINIGRLLLGGIVAGVVLDVLGYLVDGVLLAQGWSDGMKVLGRPDITTNQIMGFNVIGLVTGIVLIWVYAAIRPRFGGSVKTAACAGVTVWVLCSLLPNLSLMWISGLFPCRLTTYTTAGALIETIVAAIAGAALYKEPASSGGA